MFGVMRETLESEGGSMRGDDDFFSVARTIPLVARLLLELVADISRLKLLTFDAQSCHTLVHGIQGILCDAS